jgi:hypothetical protein
MVLPESLVAAYDDLLRDLGISLLYYSLNATTIRISRKYRRVFRLRGVSSIIDTDELVVPDETLVIRLSGSPEFCPATIELIDSRYYQYTEQCTT